jgi:hypothetical protein
MPRNPIEKHNVSWENRFGTTISGNLPGYKENTCIEDAIDLVSIQTEFPWVKLQDFHYYHIRCPYATESSFHFVMDMNRNSPTFWGSIDVSGEISAHTSTSGIMIKNAVGSRNGWTCVDPNCPYYLGTASGSHRGVRYFYR